MASKNDQWWDNTFSNLAENLTVGVLNEMKKRILNTKIKGEKLELEENSTRMRQFFERETKRYENRKSNLIKKLVNPENQALRTKVAQLRSQIDSGKDMSRLVSPDPENQSLKTEISHVKADLAQMKEMYNTDLNRLVSEIKNLRYRLRNRS